MYLHNERNHASLWALGRKRQTRLARRIGCSCSPPELATNNMRALPLNVNGSPAVRAEASNLLLQRLGPGVQKASCRAGSAYGVIFRTSATPFASARNLASSHAYSVIGLA
jgi:hypothetical protein